MNSNMPKNHVIKTTQFNNEVRWLKRASEIENKKQHTPWCGKGNPCIGAESGVAEGIHLQAGVVLGMFSNHLNSEGRTTPTPTIGQFFNYSPPLQKSNGVSTNIEVEEIITSLGRNNSGFAKSEWHKPMVEHLIHMVESSRMEMARGNTSQAVGSW